MMNESVRKKIQAIIEFYEIDVSIDKFEEEAEEEIWTLISEFWELDKEFMEQFQDKLYEVKRKQLENALPNYSIPWVEII